MADVRTLKNGRILCTFPLGYEVECEGTYFSAEINLSVRMGRFSAYDTHKMIYTITSHVPAGTKVSIERKFVSIDKIFDWLSSANLRDIFLGVFDHDLNNISQGQRLLLATHVWTELEKKLEDLKRKIEEIRTAHFLTPKPA